MKAPIPWGHLSWEVVQAWWERGRCANTHAPNMQDTRWRGRLMDAETFWNTSFPRMSIFVTMLPLQLHYRCFVMWNPVPADWCTVSNKAHHKLVCQPGELKRKKNKSLYLKTVFKKKKNKLHKQKYQTSSLYKLLLTPLLPKGKGMLLKQGGKGLDDVERPV